MLEMNDFEKKIKFGCKGKISKFLTNTLAKTLQKVLYIYSFLSEHP